MKGDQEGLGIMGGLKRTSCLLAMILAWAVLPGIPAPLSAAPAAKAKSSVTTPSQPPFALVDPALAASLSTRSASTHTRAVLIHAAANQGRSARPVAWISGEADSVAALQDLPVILDLAVAWRLGWDAPGGSAAIQAGRFRDAALGWLDAWIKTCRLGFMPLNESRLDCLLVSWDLLRAAAGPEQQDRVTVWLRNLAEGYLVDRNGQPSAAQANFWQSHRVKLACLAAFSLGDPALIGRAEAAFCQQISRNLLADGSPIDFVEHDSLAYAVYDLQALMVAALAARAHGRDWFHYRGANGASLETALLWLADFAAGKSSHREFLHSQVARERDSAAGQGGLGKIWNPVNACTLYWLAVRFDDRWLPLAARLGRDHAWLAIVFPTAAPPVYAQPSPRTSPSPSTGITNGTGLATGTGTASSAASQNQAQLQKLLQALGQGGTAATGTATGSIPNLLSLLDTLGTSGTGSTADGYTDQ